MITLTSTDGNYAFNCPTNLNDIKAEYLKRLTENINLSKYHSVVALVQRVPVMEIVFTSNTGKFKQDSKVGVTCVMAKPDEETTINVGDILTIDATVIERAHHLGIQTRANIDRIIYFFSKNPKLRDALREGDIKDENGNPLKEIYCLSFKIVPTNAIVASINPDAILDDPYFTVDKVGM